MQFARLSTLTIILSGRRSSPSRSSKCILAPSLCMAFVYGSHWLSEAPFVFHSHAVLIRSRLFMRKSSKKVEDGAKHATSIVRETRDKLNGSDESEPTSPQPSGSNREGSRSE